MAELAAAFWGWRDDIGLSTMAQRLRFFAPDNIAAELTAADVPRPIAAAAEGWRRLPGLSAPLWEIASLVHRAARCRHRSARPDTADIPAG